MEFRFLTIVCFLLMETAPLDKQVVTIIGSISGVKPTAMEIPNKNASSQSPFVRPLIRNTSGTMTSMKRISTQDTALTPFVKFVSTASFATAEAMEPNKVLSPTHTATAVALPEMTLLPINAILEYSVMLSFLLLIRAVFSIGSLSPVNEDCDTNKSFASMILTSAGIISPADKCMISPVTNSSIGISIFSFSSRVTVHVVVIIASSFSAAFPLLDSCRNRNTPLIMTIIKMIMAVAGSKSSGVLPSI